MPEANNYLVQLTPPGRAALASVLVSGPCAVTIVESLFRPASGRPPSRRAAGRIVFGTWREPHGEEIVVCRTDDSTIELHCHGGQAAVARITEDLIAADCQPLDSAQWALQNTTDRIVAEAQIALADAKTERSAAVLLDQYHGALTRELAAITELLRHEAASDAQGRIRSLLQRAQFGLHLTVPWHVVLAGPPNAGKSSLINALVGYERAIVFDQPGTTRDVVTANTALDGWPVRLADTAGLRVGRDLLEEAGIERSHQQLVGADLAILVFDRSIPWSADDQRLVQRWTGALLVHNKSDLPPARSTRPAGIVTSATQRSGLDALIDAIVQRLVGDAPPPGIPVPFLPRHVQGLVAAHESLKAANDTTTKDELESLLRPAAID